MHLLQQIRPVTDRPVYTSGFLHFGSALRATGQNLGWPLEGIAANITPGFRCRIPRMIVTLTCVEIEAMAIPVWCPHALQRKEPVMLSTSTKMMTYIYLRPSIFSTEGKRFSRECIFHTFT